LPVTKTLSIFALLAAFVAAAPLASAQPAPAPTPSATPPTGVVGSGALSIQSALFGTGNNLTLGCNVAFEQRDGRFRLDVLSVAIPGMDPTAGVAAAMQFFPPGGFTVVFDSKAGTYTVWSNAKQKYFSDKFSKPSLNATPTPGPTPTPSAEPFNPMTAFARFKNVKTLSFALVKHSTVNGHPTSEYDFQYARDDGAGNTFETHGQLHLADDLEELPVQLQASVVGSNFPQSSMRIDLTKIELRAPSIGDFRVPAGFAKAATIGELLQR
jgi:hypothetical protein